MIGIYPDSIGDNFFVYNITVIQDGNVVSLTFIAKTSNEALLAMKEAMPIAKPISIWKRKDSNTPPVLESIA